MTGRHGICRAARWIGITAVLLIGPWNCGTDEGSGNPVRPPTEAPSPNDLPLQQDPVSQTFSVCGSTVDILVTPLKDRFRVKTCTAEGVTWWKGINVAAYAWRCFASDDVPPHFLEVSGPGQCDSITPTPCPWIDSIVWGTPHRFKLWKAGFMGIHYNCGEIQVDLPG